MAEVSIHSKTSSRTHPLESDVAHMHALVSWRAVVAGLLISFLTMAILLSLGMAMGGVGLSDGTSAQNAGIFTGVWFLVSALISLFAGSYFAARISTFHTNRIGSAQGLVIAALFFGLFLWQSFAAIGWAGRMTGNAIGGAASAVSGVANQAADNPTVNKIVQSQLGDLNLRSEPQTVLNGIATRMLSGDTEGAKNYLAAQAGISPTEADRRITELRTQVEQATVQARETAAGALQATGWTLFATLFLGTAAAIGGGALGSLANLRKPLTREQLDSVSHYETAPV